MTGFARRAAETPLGTLTWELRAVNHRYLDVQFRLPEELRPKETELRQQVAEILKRGKIDCSLHFRRAISDSAELTLNHELVAQIRAKIEELFDLLPETHAIDPVDVLRWPGVVTESEVEAGPLFEQASRLLGETLDALYEMRASEGERIGEMLESRCKDIVVISKGIRKRMPDVLAAVRARQQERIDKLNVDADPARLETELALIAQKLDVDEELDRVESHISEIREAIASREPVGRRLDFLLQELNREANTLASKSADTKTTKAAVELKVLIEQMREQIQNVE
ncbi:MAG: YicC/YloC family endoribonuclease [Woeseiaceae bacterium]